MRKTFGRAVSKVGHITAKPPKCARGTICSRGAAWRPAGEDNVPKVELLLGRRIAEARRAHGWSQSQLAERVGVTLETISRLERGATMPSITRISKIAEVLGVSLSTLARDGAVHDKTAIMRDIEDLLRPCSATTLGYVRDLIAVVVQHEGPGDGR